MLSMEQLNEVVEPHIREMTQDVVKAIAQQFAQALGGAVNMPRRRATVPRGQKRTPEELQAIREKFLTHVSQNPGQRIEEISKSIGISTHDLQLPVRQLVDDEKIATKGQKRATQYFPLASAPAVAPTPAAASPGPVPAKPTKPSQASKPSQGKPAASAPQAQ